MEKKVDKKSYTEGVLTTLRRIIRAVDLYSRKLVQVYGLTGPQVIVLREAVRSDGIPVNRLAARVSLSHATVTSILSRLEKHGYIERQRSQADKREVLVRATDKGRQIIEKNPSLLHEHFMGEFERLEEWEQTQILSNLLRIASFMEVQEAVKGFDTKDSAPILASGPLSVSEEESIKYLENDQSYSGEIPVAEKAIAVACPQCNAGLTFPMHRAGNTATCPECSAQIEVPAT